MDTKKYIIEIPDNTAWIQWVKVSDKDGHVCFDFKDPEDLTPYTEPDIDAIRNEAYEKGVQDTKQHWVDALRSCAYRLGYENGLNAAWDVARKIGSNSMCSLEEMGFDFGQCVVNDYNPSWFVVKNYSASECIEKIRQYEQEQEEIKVGDEVNGKGGKGIIARISNDGDHFNVMWENGSTGYYMREDFKKTGRHFPEIAEVLRKMQEEME